MKRIQKGFTLIELMIVVAIIGILAAVAIPAYQDYVVKAKLSKIQSTLDPIKLALSMYYQENGSFPVGTETATPTPGASAANGFWNSIGLSTTPAVPNELATVVATGPSTTAPTVNGVNFTGNGLSVQLVLTVAAGAVKAATIDGGTVTISGYNPSGTAIVWNCTASAAAGGGALDIIAKKYFGCP